jgi:hypothetical protein
MVEPTPKFVLIFLAQTDVYKQAADPKHMPALTLPHSQMAHNMIQCLQNYHFL